MSSGYVKVQWNQHKKVYDRIVFGFFMLIILSFAAATVLTAPENREMSVMIILIRAFGLCAITSLHIILAIGPLARLNEKFLPLLYNRRHLGVMTFCVAILHAFFVVLFYHGFGVMNPLLSLLLGNTQYHSLTAFPFELFGLAALSILFAMAVTSHDFWQKYLGKVFWKTLHMSVYAAYALLLAHVLLGVGQSENSSIYTVVLVAGFVSLSVLNIAAAFKSLKQQNENGIEEGWLKVAPLNSFKNNRAKVVTPEHGESIAVFVYDGKVSAVTNLCAHQGGPLGEGKIIDGCITCPWHGWQYKPDNGQSPPPFEEKIETYETKIVYGVVYVSEHAQKAGTAIEPSSFDSNSTNLKEDDTSFYAGYLDMPQSYKAFLSKTIPMLASGLLALALSFAWVQKPVSNGMGWDDTGASAIVVEGVLVNQPYTLLRFRYDSDNTIHTAIVTSMLKTSVDERLEGLYQKALKLKGVMIKQDGRFVFALLDGDDAIAQANFDVGVFLDYQTKPLGKVSLKGEIVDPKCYIGAMKPGGGKVHKSCAVLCIRGGIPPMFVERNKDLHETFYLISDTQGKALVEPIIPFVGDPIAIEGQLEQIADMKILKVDPASIARLKP